MSKINEIAEALRGCNNFPSSITTNFYFFYDSYIVFRVRPKEYDIFLLSKKFGLLEKYENQRKNEEEFPEGWVKGFNITIRNNFVDNNEPMFFNKDYKRTSPIFIYGLAIHNRHLLEDRNFCLKEAYKNYRIALRKYPEQKSRKYARITYRYWLALKLQEMTIDNFKRFRDDKFNFLTKKTLNGIGNIPKQPKLQEKDFLNIEAKRLAKIYNDLLPYYDDSNEIKREIDLCYNALIENVNLNKQASVFLNDYKLIEEDCESLIKKYFSYIEKMLRTNINTLGNNEDDFINKYFDSSLQGIFSLPEFDYLTNFLYNLLNKDYDLRFDKNRKLKIIYPKGWINKAKNNKLINKEEIFSFVDLFGFIDFLCEFAVVKFKLYNYNNKTQFKKNSIIAIFKNYSISRADDKIAKVFSSFLDCLKEDFVEFDFIGTKYKIETNKIFDYINLILIEKIGLFLVRKYF